MPVPETCAPAACAKVSGAATVIVAPPPGPPPPRPLPPAAAGGDDNRRLLVRATVNRDGLAGAKACRAGDRDNGRAHVDGGAHRGGACRANRRDDGGLEFAPVSMLIVWPAAKSATLATLILVAPAAEAADRVVAACVRKSVQLLSASRPSGKRPTLLLGPPAAGAPA